MEHTTRAGDIREMLHLKEYQILLRLSWPVILSMMVQGIYGLIDSVYLSQLGEVALSAMALSAVVVNLVSAFFSGITTGMNAVISRAVGAEDLDSAKYAMVSGCVVQFFFVMLFTAGALVLTPLYFQTTTPDTVVQAYGGTYLTICLLGCFAMAGQVTLERLLQMAGYPKFMMFAQFAGLLVNILLDPLLIFGLLGMPKLGMAGAAVATVIGQIVACLSALYFNLTRNTLLFDGALHLRMFRRQEAQTICLIGIPTSIIGIASAAGSYCINRLLIMYSPTANAAFGAYAKVESVLLIPAQGLSAGLVTMFSLFRGQRNFPRLRATIRTGFTIIGAWGAFCAVSLLLVPQLYLSIFRPTRQMLEIGIPACRIVGATFLFSGYFLVVNSFFQSVGKSIYSLFFSFSRQIFVRIPAAILLVRAFSIHAIWWSWPISELTSDLVCITLFLKEYRRLRAALADSGVGSALSIQG